MAKIEGADAYILASPTNFSTVTALFKRFMDRLAVYAYWPWEAYGPKFRKSSSKQKKALHISSSATGFCAAMDVQHGKKQLMMTANTIGAKPGCWQKASLNRLLID